MKQKMLVIVCLTLIASVPATMGAIFSDDFNNQTLGDFSGSQTAPVGTWNNGGDGGSITVINDPTGATGRGKILEIEDDGTNGYSWGYASFASNTIGPITVKYDVYHKDIEGDALLVRVMDTNPGWVYAIYTLWNENGSGDNVFQDYASGWTDLCSFQEGRWYHVEMKLHHPTEALRVTSIRIVDVASGIPIFQTTSRQGYGSPDEYTELDFGQPSNDTETHVYLDNISVVASVQVHAGQYFSDNLDNRPLGTLPSGAAADVGSWVVDTSGGVVDVVNDPTGAGRGQVIDLVDDDAGAYSWVSATFSSATTEPIIINYDIYHKDVVGDELAVFVRSLNYSRGVYTYWREWGVSYDNYADHHSGNFHTMGGFSTGKWYKVKIQLSDLTEETNVLSTTITDIAAANVILQTSSTRPFYSGIAEYASIQFGQTGASPKTHVYLDNILIYREPLPVTGTVLIIE